MVEMTLHYEGGLHTRAHHGPSGSTLSTDAPVDNRGKGEAFSPTDLLAASLASCMLTTMAIRGESEGWRIDGASACVEKHMALEPRRRVGRVVVALEMPAGVPVEARDPLEQAARGCPVASSLGPQVEIDLRIRWRAGEG
jgi:putative redox protein